MKRKLIEDIDYGGRPERMDPNLERKLSDPEGMFAKNPAFRGGARDVERLATDRFAKVAEKLRQVTGIQDLTGQNVKMMMAQEMMSKTYETIRIESRHKERLKKLAIEICLEEGQVDPTDYIIDARLNESPIDVSNFQYSEQEPKDEDDEEEEEGQAELPSFDIEDLTPEEEFELEKHKRNIINALIQGAAKKGHFVFQKPSVKSQLDAIDNRLYQNYSAIMAINDFLYFSMEQMIEQMSETGNGVAGKVQLKNTTSEDEEQFQDENPDADVPDTKIVAEGLMFPILCHEIIKGFEEAKGRHGLPKEPSMRQKVLGQTDILSNEPMQLRLGPEIYEKIRFALPDELYEESNKGLINWFQIELYQIPAKEFLIIIGDVISEDESKNKKATAKFEEIMRKAQELKSEFDEWKAEQGKEDDSDDDDDDIDDFLSSLGISRPE